MNYEPRPPPKGGFFTPTGNGVQEWEMINIEPPGVMEWTLLVIVGALAGSINALKSYAEKGKKQAAIVGAVEGATALFVTITSFLIMQSLIPVIFGVQVPALGLIGISGVIAHIGLRQAIRLAIRMADTATTK